VWNALTGERIVDYQLPPVAGTPASNGGDMPMSSSSAAAPGSDMGMDMIMPPYYPYVPSPSITGMMLKDNRLVVTASNYGYLMNQNLGYTPVLSNYRATRIFVLDTTPLAGTSQKNGTLELLGYDDINGDFNSMRAVGDNLHIVTTVSVNPYPYLQEPLDRYRYPELSDAEYEQMAQDLVKSKLLTNFTNTLTKELKLQGSLPNLARINMMQTAWNSSMSDNLMYYPNSLWGSIVQITSLDMMQDMSSSQRPKLRASGSFLPYYTGTVYASDKSMIIAAQGYDYRPRITTGDSTDFTYLLAFSLNGTTTSPNSMGQVPGTLMNSYSVDVMDDVLRIGTTARNGWEWGGGPILFDTASTGAATSQPADAPTASPVPLNTWAPNKDSEGNDVPLNTLPPRDWSLTTNYLTLLQLPSDDSAGETGEMKKLSELQLGKMDESFKSMRFFDNVAYAITALQMDPMYVLDLSDPTDPRILGELDNITGFSDYLHSMNDENTLLLGVGQDTDKDGMVLGLMLSVFDATDPANPQLAQRLVVERDPDTYSSSEATYDFHAIRYDQPTQQLIIPISINNWNTPQRNFNGFSVFSVSQDRIKEKCRIEHGNYYANGNACFYCSYLPSRSFIFDGDVMTVNSQFVRMTDPDTCTSKWDFEMDIQDPSGQCCGYIAW
jgi:hypothetical protein